ncbi:MAG TPA: HlyD family efflux transporter periplasmic adaptor subunit, partial [Candidatus Kapabacteria bacterium]
VYQREWNGKKRVVGSTVSPWDPSVATLPDLDTMESITYVNEVDIQKIQKGQQVKLGLDSDPDKTLTGVVTSVANIGEQRPNSDSKVFEVRIIINERDTSLRPSMTTSNAILVSSIPQKMYVPLECLHSDSGRTFVYKQDGSSLIKQEVKVGMTNDNEAAIEAGIIKTDKLYLSLPPEKSVLRATVKLLPPSKDSTATKPKVS